MDTQTIDQEYDKLNGEFEDVAKTVQALAAKLQAAEQAGDENAAGWLGDLKQIAQDISDEQTQAKVLLLALHSFIAGIAQGQEAASESSADHPPLFAPGHEPAATPPPPQTVYVQQQQPMMGGMFGGYMGGGFARSMEMGAAMGLGSSLISSIFR